MVTKEELISAFRKANIIYHGDIMTRHGDKSDYYVDVKEFITVPAREKILVDYMKNVLMEKYPDVTCLAGMGYGGVPLVESVGNELNLKKIFVRDKPKQHGIPKIYEGELLESDNFVVIDDVLNSGGSIIETKNKILKQCKARFIGGLAVVNRGHPKLDFPWHTLVDVEEL